MSLYSAIGDYLAGVNTNPNQQTQDEVQANLAKLRAQATTFNDQKLANGTITQAQHDQAQGAINSDSYTSPGAAYSDSVLYSVSGGVLGAPDPNAPPDAGTGAGNLFKDLVVLAFIGGALYLFVKLGGLNQIKKLAGL